jgi:excisionase family DNA binding protein
MVLSITTVVHVVACCMPQNQMDRLLLRPTEAAEVIGLGRSKIYELLATGELPSIRIGSSVRVPVDALRAWIDKQLAHRAEAGR